LAGGLPLLDDKAGGSGSFAFFSSLTFFFYVDSLAGVTFSAAYSAAPPLVLRGLAGLISFLAADFASSFFPLPGVGLNGPSST